MQKVSLTDEQLNQLISLRKGGGKWLQIQRIMGISRQIVKREYEDWELSQDLGELKEARRDVAAQAFKEHVDFIVALAESLTGHLRVPSVIERNLSAEEFLNKLWETDIISQVKSSGSSDTRPSSAPTRNLRENRFLFGSLVAHTRDKVRWKDLDDWKQDWDLCTSGLRRLYEEALKNMDSLLSQEERRSPGLRASIEKNAEHPHPLEQMAEAIVTQLVQRSEKNEFDQGRPVTRVYSQGNYSQLVFPNSYTIILKFSNPPLAETANRVCNTVGKNISIIYKGAIESFTNNACMMKKLRDRFEEVLEPLVLRPMILRTRCDLCPA